MRRHRLGIDLEAHRQSEEDEREGSHIGERTREAEGGRLRGERAEVVVSFTTHLEWVIDF